MLRLAGFIRAASLTAIAALTACSADLPDLPPLPDGGVVVPPPDQGLGLTADLSIALTAPPAIGVGAALEYEIDVTNHGDFSAAEVTVTAAFPSEIALQSATGHGWSCAIAAPKLTCTGGTLDVGTAATITVVATAPATVDSIATTASVQSTTTDPTTANNTASATTAVLAPTDLAIAVAGPTGALPAGGLVTYSITVTNQGPGPAATISVLDPLPTGARFSSGSGDGWSCSETTGTVACDKATLDANAASVLTLVLLAPRTVGTVVNQLTVASVIPDPVAANNTASASVTLLAAADLSITQRATPAVLGAPLSYTLAVHNAGPNAAAAVSVVQTLPDAVQFTSAAGTGWSCSHAAQVVTCTLPSLASDASAPDLTVAGAVLPAGPAPFALTATAKVSSSTLEAFDQDNSVTSQISLDSNADLAVAMTGDADPVHVNTSGICGATDCVTYTVQVTNHGPALAQDLDLAVFVPDSQMTGEFGAFVDAAGDGWACKLDGYLDCTRADLAAGATATVVVRWLAPAHVPSHTLNASADVFSLGDVHPNNDEGAVETTVVP
jgi:uncharacterized repeat protein (TIGR01451 family)